MVGEKQGSLPGRDFQAGEMQCKGPVVGVGGDGRKAGGQRGEPEGKRRKRKGQR